jgi:hypothetical protein
MATPPPFTLTNESITVIWEGKSHVVQKGSPQFNALRKAIITENWKAVPKNLTVAKSIKDWAKGKFTLGDNTFSYEGRKLPRDINERITKMATTGDDPTPLFKFWERLQKNPSSRSVAQLWPFLAHKGIPLTKEGTFLAYKGVTQALKDAHTGTVDNKPGIVNKLPRNQISDDPDVACHFGFHVGALEYAKSFSARVIICEVDPENVVCVPNDTSQHKMRVCEYKVIGHHSGESLPSTVFHDSSAVPPKRQVLPKKKSEDHYDPEKDFLADRCEECDKKIPPDLAAEDNRYHAETCSFFDRRVPSEEEEAKAKVKEKAPAKKTGKEKKKEHKAKKKAGKSLVQEYERLNKLALPQLMDESIETLRGYAGHGLKIVGASKISGGKTALVSAIIVARDA